VSPRFEDVTRPASVTEKIVSEYPLFTISKAPVLFNLKCLFMLVAPDLELINLIMSEKPAPPPCSLAEEIVSG
jgi:hypothetical protein